MVKNRSRRPSRNRRPPWANFTERRSGTGRNSSPELAMSRPRDANVWLFVTQTNFVVNDYQSTSSPPLETSGFQDHRPHKEDICYRHDEPPKKAVKAMAPKCDAMRLSARQIQQRPNAWSGRGNKRLPDGYSQLVQRVPKNQSDWRALEGLPQWVSPQGASAQRC